MTKPPATDRRAFMAGVLASAATPVVSGPLWGATPHEAPAAAPPRNAGRLFKAVKWGMIGHGSSVLEKFEVCQQLGFDGMELVSPADFAPEQAREASRATGMPVHGLVDMKHWDVRLSSPDEAVRDQGRVILEQAIRDASAFGGDSVLLVPGRVSGADETHEHVWRRSIEQIRRVLPLASRLGVRVLIENVWNGFCESPEQLRDYLDEIASPWVGSYYDIGNSQKFSPTEQWIRVLGQRIVKLDVKDWGVSNGFCKIGDGDVNWPAVRSALADIGYTGWCTAEVAGGGRERLADIARRMDRVLEL
ncbi:MAG: sugar phosphate isomerase/epimerase [Planctomycetales bacterium]|nr:sugar phosphate isomerase/epimerase [Planctomycetales bacterium]